MITRQDNAIMWRWDSDPFGSAAPNQNPQSIGTFIYNLRFPGEYYQAETGLNYNYFRDYDPRTGRYIESDPIGLQGGINTYAYAGQNPITSADASDLVKWTGLYNFTSGGMSKSRGSASGIGFTLVLKSACVEGKQDTVVVNALAGSAGLGMSIFGPITIGASGVTFNDNLSTLNPYVFDGSFSFSNFGTFVASFTTFTMGGALGDGSGLNASTSAFDVSGGKGTSRVTKVRTASCACDVSQQ
jgi:RHS repeat-associated protein